jgi:virulence factor Mce-like protein
MRSPRAAFSSIFDNPVLVGTVTILVVMVAVYLSYIAENGLPFIPTYAVNVQVADGGELNKNVPVRIGGARVGQVLKITAEPADNHYDHPYAQLELAIDKSLEPLPANTHYQVRLSSVLGGQYIELFPGTKTKGVGTIPDGGTLAITNNAKTNHNIGYVDISQAFDVFGPKTQAGIRLVSQGLGDAFAGRGTQLNDAITSTSKLLGPLQRVLNIFSAPSTQLANFIDGLDATTSAIAPESTTLTELLANAASTFNAVDVKALGTTLDDLPSTEVVATNTLTKATPVLTKLASITQALRPAAQYLPTAASRLDQILRAAPPTLRLLTSVSPELTGGFNSGATLAADPASTEAFTVLGVNDLGTTGSSAFIGLGAILNTVEQAQDYCNAAGLWVRNFASALSEGDSTGNWLRTSSLIDADELTQSATPSSDLHINANPVEGPGGCQAGNESYSGTTNFNHPTATSTTVDNTTPPDGVLQQGINAGLVPK